MAVDFTDAEIRAELANLGYHDVNEEQLQVFKKKLLKLIHIERSKNVSPNIFNNKLETSGKMMRHDNQRIQNNYRKGLLSENEFSSKPSTPNPYGLHYGMSDTVADVRGYSSNTYSPQISRQPSVTSKMVKWKLPREGAHASFAGDTVKNSPRSFDRDAQFLEDDISKKRFARWDDMGERNRPTSAGLESRYGHRSIIKNIPGVITRKEHPHTRNLYKTKPFERHQMYLRAWRAQPPVGEACRQSVCWKIHKKLLQKEEIKYPQKTLNPNSYVVPTDKPRYELRWAVRHCNENYEMPPCGFFHEI